MSQSTRRTEMLKQFTTLSKKAENVFDNKIKTNELEQLKYANAELAIGSRSGYEVLLPKYDISTGRDGDSQSISQARIYMGNSREWQEKSDLNLGEVSYENRSFVGFLLSSVQESKNEKVQTMPLNGDNYSVTFYGESPSIYAFQGILYNTHFARWREIFTLLYKNAFRGTKIANHRQLLHIVYDNKIVSGWMLNLNQNISAESDTMSSFNFQMLVRSENLLAETADLQYNNAYFQGAGIPRRQLDKLADISQIKGDYLNAARIQPPPKRRGGAFKRKADCIPGRISTKKDSQKRKTNPKYKGQYIRNGSPTANNCDISQAVLNVVRNRDSALQRVETAFSAGRIKSSTRTSRRTKIKARARAQLRVAWKNLEQSSDIGNASAKRRAEITSQSLRDAGITSIDQITSLDSATASKIKTAIGKVQLDYSTTSQAKQ